MSPLLEYFGLKEIHPTLRGSKQQVMSYKVKSVLYFASFVIAAITYYNVGKTNGKELAMTKEIAQVESNMVATQNAANMNNLQ